MILMALFKVLFGLLKVLFSWLSLPAMPDGVKNLVMDCLVHMGNAASLLWLFFDKDVVKICFPVALACANFDKLYDLLMWILAKLPIGISKN